MNVFNLFPNRFGLKRIAIISTAALPEPVMHIAIRLHIRHTFQEVRRVFADEMLCSSCYGKFNRAQEAANVIQ